MTNMCSLDEVRSAMVRLTAETAVVIGRLEPRDIPVSEMPALLDMFITLEKRVAAGRLLVAARAAEAAQWKRDGYRSAAEWLAAQQGTSTGRAGDDIATSRLLADLEDTADAVRDGRLSPEQAGAVTDGASVNPGAEADLLDRAERDSLKNLKDEAARRKAEVEDQEKKQRRIHRQRTCRTFVDRDGRWNLRAQGPIGMGAGFEVEWEYFINQRFTDARLNGERERRDQYAFDALMALARHAGTNDTPTRRDTTNCDTTPPTPSGPSTPATTGRRENLRHLALIRVDADALQRGAAVGGEVCEIAGLGPIPVSTARELLGESILKLVITRGVDVLNVTHLGRGPTAAQEVALLWNQSLCTAEGCNRTQRLEYDHRQPWATQRVTEVSNLDPLCDHHHTLKTRQNWALIDGHSRRPMVPPHDPRHPQRGASTDRADVSAVPSRPAAPAATASAEGEEADVPRRTGAPGARARRSPRAGSEDQPALFDAVSPS